MADDDDRDPSIEAALRLAAPDQGERGFLLPIMRQGDAIGPAVPGAIYEPYQAIKRFMGHGYDPGTGDVEGVRNALDVAANVTAGSSLGRAPAGSLAAGSPVRIPNPIRAYHGSPYDFNEFDMSKVGTGEGAQAYGHGLYFAENEPVAQSYRHTQVTPEDEAALDNVAIYRDKANLNDKHAAEMARADAAKGHWDKDALERAAEMLESGNLQPGRMYEVALHATPESFLDWDKPLGEQSEAVRNAFSSLLPDTPLTRAWRENGVWENAKVGSMYHNLAREYGADITKGPNPSANAQASNRFAEAGIPGVRYLDQGSRGKGEGTHNYSVWSPEIIEILRKYGIIGPTAAGALMSQYGNEGKQ